MTQEAAEAYEQDWIGALQWFVRNRLLPDGSLAQPPNIPLGWRQRPVYYRGAGQWYARPGSSKQHQRFRDTFYP